MVLKKKEKNLQKKDFERVKNGYICPNGRFMKKIEVKTIKHRKPHKDDSLPDNCKTKRYFFETHSCEGCSNIENCKNKTLVIQSIDLNFEMTEKFLDKRHNLHYKSRFSRSEGINGFLKGDNGVLKLIGTTDNAVNNEIQLRNTIYNLTRLINLKDTAY
ncbi:transposase [Methanobrevibacter sp.]|uniref:transposase n=1 Tax=Methanobrevibacter sp. TaxID=66852 RepID=UPI00388F12E1